MQASEKLGKEMKILEKDARNMLQADTRNETVKDIITLINTFERLGLSYKFEKEIEDHLERLVHSFDYDGNQHDLLTVSLLFRILRQHGYEISSGMYISRYTYTSGHS